MIGIDFDSVRRQVPLPAFLESLGLELRQEGDTYRARCPLHDERHGRSLILYSDGRWFCHGKCAADWPKGGDVIDLAGALWRVSDRRCVVERLVEGDVPEISSPRQAVSRQSLPPKWPARNLEQIDKIVRDGIGLYDLWESSPVRFDNDRSLAEEIVDILFPGNPLLCIGETVYRFATRPRGDWRGKLSRLPLIVANPMLSVTGIAQHGGESQHTLHATAARVYLAIEFDFSRLDNKGEPTVFGALIDPWECAGITVADACAALLWYLADRLPLVVAVHSGGKSVHGWFAVFDRDEESESWLFMQRAFELGADPVTWRRSQFVRLPDGRRQNGVRQVTYYFDRSKAVTL
jgi:hypothetical protein